jgi:hypothetical protein
MSGLAALRNSLRDLHRAERARDFEFILSLAHAVLKRA